MVYESDFYTTRRPYTRPTLTSYSVTRREVPWHKVPLVPRPSQVAPCFTVFGSRSTPKEHGVKLPGLGKGQTFHHNIPSIGHKKLVVVIPSAHNTRTKQSVWLSEIERINNKVRPCLAYQPTEDYLNSRSIVSFDDETRSIRAKTAEILKRIHTPIPRAQRPMPLPGDAYYSHSELPITDRISSDNYIDRLLSANRDVSHDVLTMSHYEEPAKKYNSIGIRPHYSSASARFYGNFPAAAYSGRRGHLACVSFAGGRPISKRRNLADDYIRDDINVLSHYGRFRAAAAAGNTVVPTAEPEYQPSTRRPPSKSSVTGSWKSNAPREPKESSKSGALTAAEQFDAAQDRKQRRREAVEAAAHREVEEEKRRKEELARQEQLAQQAVLDRQQELERKAQEEEEALKVKEEEERKEAERRAQEEADRLVREEEERLLREEEERIAREEEEERKRQEEEEKKAKKAKKEAEKKAREEAERKAKEEEEKKKKEEEEKRAKEEAERLAKEEEERKAREEAERKAKEEAERVAKEEAERLAKEEAERLAKEEEELRLKEEEEKRLKEEEERLAKEAEEKAAAEEAQNVDEAPKDSDAAEPVIEEPAEANEPIIEEPQSPNDAEVTNDDDVDAQSPEENEDED